MGGIMTAIVWWLHLFYTHICMQSMPTNAKAVISIHIHGMVYLIHYALWVIKLSVTCVKSVVFYVTQVSSTNETDYKVIKLLFKMVLYTHKRTQCIFYLSECTLSLSIRGWGVKTSSHKPNTIDVGLSPVAHLKWCGLQTPINICVW